MKILIATGYFPENPYADDKIAVAIAKELKMSGHECMAAGLTYDIEPEMVELDSVCVYKIPYYSKALMNAMRLVKNELPASGIKQKDKIRFAVHHPYVSAVLKLCRNQKTDYGKEICRIIHNNQIDCLISQVWEFEKTEELLFSSQLTIPKIYYQLDPVGLSEYKEYQDPVWRKREVEAMEHADAIITSPELLEQYRSTEDYGRLKDKMHAIPFPTFRPRKKKGKSVIQFDPAYTNIVFCGTVEDESRNPVPALTYLNRLSKAMDHLRIYFIGRFLSEKGRKYIKDNMQDIVIYHDPVSTEEIDDVMQEADFLLNIGNSFKNMVPSKIFSYFSAGLPVIQFQKIAEDPSRKYFERYPLTCIIEEYKEEDCISRLKEFIGKQKGKRVDEAEAEKLFHDCTASYAAEKILEIAEGLRKA